MESERDSKVEEAKVLFEIDTDPLRMARVLEETPDAVQPENQHQLRWNA
jgi:hypothetical protein